MKKTNFFKKHPVQRYFFAYGEQIIEKSLELGIKTIPLIEIYLDRA
jgi:hypothetical protein